MNNTIKLTSEQIKDLQSGKSITIEPSIKALRSYARQLNWLNENNDNWVADWNNSDQHKYYIYFNNAKKIHCISKDYLANSIGLVYMSKDNAYKLCKLLNDGIVEF